MSDPTAVDREMMHLAPLFRAAVTVALAECHAAGLDAMVFEAHRTNERQAWLYAQGRTRPGAIVTNASDAMHGWHFFGLAVDVISRSREWDAPADWWRQVAEIFERHGCDWGGRWKAPDLPHFQWGRCRASPTVRARALYEAGGLVAVWREVGAIGAPEPEPELVIPEPHIPERAAEPLPLPPIVDVPVPVPTAPPPRDWSDPEPKPSLWGRLTNPVRRLNPMRAIFSRVAAAIVAVLLTFVAGTLGVEVSPAVHDSLVEGVTLLGLGVWGIAYALLHRLIDRKVNPADVAKHPAPSLLK